MTATILAVDPALRSSGWAVVGAGRRGVTQLLAAGTVRVPASVQGLDADRELIHRVVAMLAHGPLQGTRIVRAVLEHAQQPRWNERTTSRSRDVLGFARGVWAGALAAFGAEVNLLAARRWQDALGIGCLPRAERLRSIPILARRLFHSTEGLHLDAATAALIGHVWLSGERVGRLISGTIRAETPRRG